jgi:predicted nucleic acid-binding protein
MPSHLLDTSVYCQPIKPKPLPSVEQRWRALGDAALAISVIGEAEVLYGLELKRSARLNSLYDELLKNRLEVLPVWTCAPSWQAAGSPRSANLPTPPFMCTIPP